MRIAHVVATYPPYRGGMGNIAYELATRMDARDVPSCVVTPARTSRHEALLVRPLARFGNAAWCPSIERVLERERISHAVLHWPFIGGSASVLRWRSSFVKDPRDARLLTVFYHMDLLASGWKRPFFLQHEARLLPAVIRHADRVVVSSRDYAEHGALASHVEELGNRFVEIPLGVDDQRFVVNREQKTHHADLRVLFVGGLDSAHQFKGLPVLLEAIAHVPRVELDVVGDGDCRPRVERLVRELGIHKRVAFLGSVLDGALPAVYQRADVVALPSTSRSEAFGIVLLEAMASGVATIASDLPGVRTVIEKGVTGILVPPSDTQALARALARFRDDRTGTDAMGAAGRKRVEDRYAWDRILDCWFEVLAMHGLSV